MIVSYRRHRDGETDDIRRQEGRIDRVIAVPP